MPRVFVGLQLPAMIKDQLHLVTGGIPGARWETRDKLHLTVRFIGEIDGGMVRRVVEALQLIRMAPFELTLASMGHFPPRGQPKTLWAGVEDPRPVTELHRRIERVLTATGLPAERRKFAPHVTVARLRNAPTQKVAAYLGHHALFRSLPFTVDSFALFSSVLTPGGSKYRVERELDLS